MTTAPCPSEEVIAQLLHGGLPAPERRTVELHLEGCRSCQSRLVGGLPRWATGGAEAPAASAGPRFLLLEDDPGADRPRVTTAYDSLLDRKVTLTFLPARAGPLAEALGEAAVVARLSHPNVVTVHDVGLLDGVPYVATELLQGVTLDVWREQQPRTARQIAQVMAAVARGLAAAHRAGVVHGDVGPQAVVVTANRPVLARFGHRGGGHPAADVRGLAATLFQIVHGHPPGDGRAAAPRRGGMARLHRLALAGLDPARGLTLEALAAGLADDPAAHRRIVALAAAAVVVVAGAFWGGAYLRANPQRRCQAGAAVIDTLWNDGRRADLRARFLASPGPAGAWPAVERALDSYAGRWRATHGEACAAAYGRRQVTSAQTFDLRLQCLDGRRASLQAFLAALVDASAPQLVRAASAVLPDAAACGASGNPQITAPPTDRAARAQIAEVQALVGQSQAAQNLGDFARAVATGARAVEAARQVGYGPVLATALLRSATAESDVAGAGDHGGLDRVGRLLDEAYAVAEVAHDDQQRLVAAREQVLLQTRRNAFAAADRWSRLAEALLTRLGRPPADAAALANGVASLRMAQDRKAEAAAAFRVSLAEARKIDPPDPRRVANAQAGVCDTTADLPRRISCLRRAIEMGKAAWGPGHPYLSAFYSYLGDALSVQPETHHEACALYRLGKEIDDRTLDPGHPNAMVGVIKLGQCLYSEGELVESRRLFEEGITRKAAPWDLGLMFANYAYLMGLLGRPEEVARGCRLSMESFEKVVDPCRSDTLLSRNGYADALGDLGRFAEAHRVLDEGMQRCKNAAPAAVASILTERGKILVAQRRPEPAARAFTEALRLYQAAKVPDRDAGFALHGLGLAFLELRRPQAALAYLERAFASRPPDNVGEADLTADVRFTLARALVAAGQARGRACTIARDAEARYRTLPSKKSVLPAVARFLARNGCARTS